MDVTTQSPCRFLMNRESWGGGVLKLGTLTGALRKCILWSGQHRYASAMEPPDG